MLVYVSTCTHIYTFIHIYTHGAQELNTCHNITQKIEAHYSVTPHVILLVTQTMQEL